MVAEETLRVVQAEKAAIRRQRDRAKARFEIGQGKITDLHEAQARLDAVETREVSARSALELRRTQFQETVGSAPHAALGDSPGRTFRVCPSRMTCPPGG